MINAYFWWGPMMASADPMISGNWIIAVIGALASAAAMFWGKKQGKREAQETEVTLKPPVPTVRTQEEPEFVTMGEFNGHLKRIEYTFTEIKEALDSERGIARTANGNIHKRIDAMSERLGDRLSKLEGSVEAVADTTSKLLDLALNNKKPGGTR
jgi:hypothetical protein